MNKDNIEIRRATLEDVEALQNLNDKAFILNPKFDPDLKLDWAQTGAGPAYFKGLMDVEEKICYAAEDGDKLVGYIAVKKESFDHRISKYIEIENIGIIPDLHRSGLGAELLDVAQQWGGKKGATKVILTCFSKNFGALRFYDAQGFEPIDIILEKDLG